MDKFSALVTGASGHIGSAIALELARSGYGVVVAYHSNQTRAEEVSRAVADLGQPTRTIALDVSDRESVSRVHRELVSSGWKISGLVNNAGVVDHVPFGEISDSSWNQIIQTNLYGAFVTTQTFMPEVLASGVGRIVNIGSIGGQAGGLNQVHYAVAKAGLIGLTKSISRLYASQKFTANCVSPGPVVSPMMDAEQKYKAAKGLETKVGLASMGTAEQVASLVAFLMTPAAGHISGQDIGVNGGAIVL